MLKALSSTVKSATLPQSDKGRVARDTSKIALPPRRSRRMIHFCSAKVAPMKNNVCREVSLWGPESSLKAAAKPHDSEADCFHHDSRRDCDLPAGKTLSERPRSVARIAISRPLHW